MKNRWEGSKPSTLWINAAISVLTVSIRLVLISSYAELGALCLGAINPIDAQRKGERRSIFSFMEKVTGRSHWEWEHAGKLRGHERSIKR